MLSCVHALQSKPRWPKVQCPNPMNGLAFINEATEEPKVEGEGHETWLVAPELLLTMGVIDLNQKSLCHRISVHF